jgi:hypothetical protein
MRIVDKADITVEFSKIKVGECFLYDRCLFIKMQPTKYNLYNVFCFVDNAVAMFKDDWQVTPVDAEVIVRSKAVTE